MPGFWPKDIWTGPTGPITQRMCDDEAQFGPDFEEVFAGKDDEGYFGKTRILTKHTLIASTFFVIIDAVGINNTGGITTVLQRMKFHYVPWVGCGIAYTTVVNAMCNLRGGKTDHMNHVAGGFAAGAVVGKCARSSLTGILTGAAIAMLGYIYKDSKMRGYHVLPRLGYRAKPRRDGTPFTHLTDYTTNWVPQRPNYWARSEADVPRIYQQGQLGDGNPNRRLW